MSKSKPKVSTKGIDSFFSKKDIIEHIGSFETKKEEKVIIVKEDCKKSKIVEEFYESLSPNEKLAHSLAEKMLGTSYDVMRTHGFLQWLKSKETKKE